MKGRSQPRNATPAPTRSPVGAVLAACVASGSLIAQHVAGKATRDTLFLTHFKLEHLPAAMMGAALVSSLAVVGISRALSRFTPARVVPATFAASAVLFLLEWWLSLRTERGAAIAVYLHTAVFGSAVVSAFWSLVNERFTDPKAAKVVIGQIASGGTVGGVLSGLVVWRASSHLSVPTMLALLAAINALGLWGALMIAPAAAESPRDRDGDQAARREGVAPDASVLGFETSSSTRIMRETPYLRDLALLVLAGAIVQALLDWLLSAHASRTHEKGPQLLAFFALFNMVVGVASFAAQTGLTRPFLERAGLAGTVRMKPIGVGITAVIALLFPVYPLIVLLRGTEAVLRSSLYRAAYELFYTPLPTVKKRATKALIDVGVDRIGTTIGSVALLFVAKFEIELATRIVLFATIGACGFATVIAARLHDGYVTALAASLKSRAIALGEEDILDRTTRMTLAETTTALLDRDKILARIDQLQQAKEAQGASGAQAAGSSPEMNTSDRALVAATDVSADPFLARATSLRSGDPNLVKAVLAKPLLPELVSLVIPMLANDVVARDAIRALRRIAPRVTGQLLDALLDHGTPARVRRRLPRVLKVCRTQRAATGLLAALSDPVFEVRVQAGLSLAQIHEEAAVVLGKDEVLAIATAEVTTGLETWAPKTAATTSRDGDAKTPSTDDLHRGLTHVFTVLGLALDREPLAIAYRAARSTDTALRGTAYEYLDVVLPAALRDVLVPLLGNMKPRAAASASRTRDPKELAEELLRSQAAVSRSG